jgi:uncharacterized membrane protein YdbT with pleckstrin-like domain
MPFPRKLLNSYETVKVDLRPHWWYLTPAGLSVVASLALALYSLSRGDSFGDKMLKFFTFALFLIALVWGLARWAKWVTTYFVVTSDRVIFRQGVLRKIGVQIPLERVNNVNFQQTFFERLLGAGDLLIESGGEDGHQRFSDIKHPDLVTNVIHEAMEENEIRARGGAPRQGAGSSQGAAPIQGVDVADQLERLEGLRNRGAITDDEYQMQKRRLLG